MFVISKIILPVYRMRSFLVWILFSSVFTSCILDKTNEEVTLSGKVTDSSGKAISEVSVTVELISDKTTTQTSSDGIYNAVVAHGGTARINFSKEGYTSQLIKTAFNNGASQAINIQMNTLMQDAFFKTDIQAATLPNTQGSLSIIVSTNVNFEVECTEDWVDCQIVDKSIIIKYKENETDLNRIAVIKLTAEYGLSSEITLTQMAGPVLRLLDYSGNENRTGIPQRDPFIQL